MWVVLLDLRNNCIALGQSKSNTSFLLHGSSSNVLIKDVYNMYKEAQNGQFLYKSTSIIMFIICTCASKNICKFKHLCLIHISFNKNCTLSILDVITINGSGSNQSNQRDFPKINRIETEMLTWFSSIFCTKFSPWISGVF